MLLKFGSNLRISKVLEWDDILVKKAEEVPEKTLDRLKQISPIALNPEKYAYIVARAVSGGEKHGPNDNGDFFGWSELLERYMTFIGAAVNIDHRNNRKEYAVGIIIDALPNEEGQWIEIVMAIDKEKAEQVYPGIMDMIEAGLVTDVSMGCLVEMSICSTCLRQKADGDESQLVRGDGLAYDPSEYCEHVREPTDEDPNPDFCKGQQDSDGELCFEDNRGTTFFEESIITTKGADKDAKFLVRLASQRTASPLARFINFRALDHVRLANVKHSQGDGPMPQMKEKEKVKRTAAGEAGLKGSELDSAKDVSDGAYGKGTEKDKETFDQSKGKAEKSESKGSQVQSMDTDTKDYVLASKKKFAEDIVAVAKLDPSLAKDIMKMRMAAEEDEEKKDEKKEAAEDVKDDDEKKEAEEGGSMGGDGGKKEQVADEVGEKPKMIEKEEDKMDDEMAKTTEAAKKKAKQLALGGKEGRPSGIKAAAQFVRELFGIGHEAAVANDDSVTWKKDQSDYGAGSEKDKAYKSQADKAESVTESEKKKQDADGFATPEERMKQQEDMKKQAELKRKAENEDKKLDHAVSEMSKGKSYEEAMKSADEAYKEDKVEEKKEEASKKTAQDEKEIQKGTEETKASPASIAEGEKEEKMQDKELSQESAGSTTDKPKVEREISAKKVTVTEKKTVTEHEDGEKSADETTPPPPPVVAEVPYEKTEDMDKDVKAVVSELDAQGETFMTEQTALKRETAVFASVKMNDYAKLNAKRIAKLEVAEKKLNKAANALEAAAKGVSEIKEANKKKEAMKLVASLAKKCRAIIAETKEETKEEETSKDEKKEAAKTAATMKQIIAESEKTKRESASTKEALRRQARNMAVSSLIQEAVEKGMVKESDRSETIKKWSSLSDERFEGVKMAVEAASSQNTRIPQSRLNREAEDGLERMRTGSDKVTERVASRSSASSPTQDQLIEEGLMEGAYAFADRHKGGVRGSF